MSAWALRYAQRAGLCAAVAAFLLAGFAPPAAAASLEYPIKAAFLYKFAPFVQWPVLPPDAFTICVAGPDPFGKELDRGVKDLTIEGRPVRIQRMETVQADAACQILYMQGTAQQSAQQGVELMRNRPVLTVTEKDDAASVIQFVIDNNRVRFDIDTDRAKAHGLIVSSKLLSLAHSVRPRRE